MPRYKMLVFSDPVEGDEDRYHEWYTGRHLADVCALDGIESAARYVVRTVSSGTSLNRFLAIYDLETENPEQVLASMGTVSEQEMPVSPALNADTITLMVCEEIPGAVYPPSPGTR